MPESLPQPILIVDSDEQSVDHISSGLKANGYLVITAPNGYDGYVRAKKEAPKQRQARKTRANRSNAWLHSGSPGLAGQNLAP